MTHHNHVHAPYTSPKMGLAPLLVDTYRKYKKGTNNFVQWLAETARATGTVNDVFKDSCQDVVPPTGGRLKGVASKEAKKAGLTHNATATCQITTQVVPHSCECCYR